MFKQYPTFLFPLCLLAISGCGTIAEKTNMLSDTDLTNKAAASIGYAPADVTLVNKTLDGTNTYFTVRSNDGKVFNCMVNGGNILTMGLTNPTSCTKKI